MTPPGAGDVRAGIFWNNLPKCLEYVFTNGVCRQCGKRLGVETGDLASIDSCDEFFRRYCRQVEEETRRSILDQARRERGEIETYPMPMLSLLTEDCLARGRDISAGGARYNSPMPRAVGIPNVADSLMALKRLVFEQRRFTLAEVAEALEANFAGREPLRQALLHGAPKYRRDDDEVDAIAAEVARQYCRAFGRYRDPRGGPCCPSLFSFMVCVAMGRMVGATPDGRRAGQPLANSLCPAQGHHPTSPTQLLNSVAKLPLDEATGGTSLLVDLPPAAARVRPDGSDPLVALLETFFRRGGTHLEFTLVRPDDLRRAQERPEEVGDLTVRVAGCSARFVDLDRAMQDHLIERTAAVAGPAVTRTSPGRRR